MGMQQSKLAMVRVIEENADKASSARQQAAVQRNQYVCGDHNPKPLKNAIMSLLKARNSICSKACSM
eukprot:9798251-Karenia_brevis.AAC.1